MASSGADEGDAMTDQTAAARLVAKPGSPDLDDAAALQARVDWLGSLEAHE